MYTPTAKGYFSGSGGLEIGVMQSGVNLLQSLDIDPEAVTAMRMNTQYFSHTVLERDIKDITVLEQEKADVMLITFPCTKYSAIADIHGTRTGDELFLHAFRHIAIEQPEMYVVENVPGMRKFKVVMEAMTKLPDYYVYTFCPVETTNWLPQKRNRLILIGTRKPFSPAHPVKSEKIPRIKDLLEHDPEVRLTNGIRHRMNGKYRDLPIIVDPDDANALAPTCVAHYAKDMSTRLVKDSRSELGVRPFTIREYARLQGYPDDYRFPDKVSSYRLIGNSVPVDMGRWIGKQIVRYFN